ncbi:MAG: tryptophanase [Armatimonadetes bacterium]|nr:tryptophanase [Armatimonadota bacterium]
MSTMPEPYRIKMVEPITLHPPETREARLRDAHYNLFNLAAEDVFIDLLTDSGTSAMSHHQWAALMQGDESYAGSRSFGRLRDAVREIFGFEDFVPTHQGRAAEHILFGLLVRCGISVLSNAHFDTTRANVEACGGRAIDLPIPEALDPSSSYPFKGDIDIIELERQLTQIGCGYALVLLTLTSNSVGGHPVSLNNLRLVHRLCRDRGVPLFIDACRYAENCYLIQQREPGCQGRTLPSIAAEIFSLCDGFTFSGKKDGLCNIGGLLAARDPRLMQSIRERLILVEGFPTYGGLAGRDLEALAVGLREALDPSYLQHRLGQVEALGVALARAGVPVIQPPGGHAVYLDAGKLLSHLPRHQFPGQALAVALYLEGGIRSCEVGGVMLGRRRGDGKDEWPPLELVRLALPRRVYTSSHLDYVAEVAQRIARKAETLCGLQMVFEPTRLRHFSARFQPVRSVTPALG